MGVLLALTRARQTNAPGCSCRIQGEKHFARDGNPWSLASLERCREHCWSGCSVHSQKLESPSPSSVLVEVGSGSSRVMRKAWLVGKMSESTRYGCPRPARRPAGSSGRVTETSERRTHHRTESAQYVASIYDGMTGSETMVRALRGQTSTRSDILPQFH